MKSIPSSETQTEPGIGHNLPPDLIDQPFEDIKQRTSDIIDNANKWLNERPEIIDEEMAGKASAFLDQIQAAAKDTEKQRKDANEPLRAAVTASDNKYKLIATKLALAKIALGELLAPWMRKKAARIAAETKAAQEAAAAARKAEEEALAKIAENKGGDVIGDMVVAEQAEKDAKNAAAAAARASKQKSGVKPSTGSGRAKSIRRRSVVRISDRGLIPLKVLRMVDVECIIKVLQADLDLAKATPGCVIETIEKVM